MSGKKILDGLRAALDGNFSAVTIEGQRWVLAPPWMPIETAPKTGDFLAHLGNGYVTRARFINRKFFACDGSGEKGDTEPTHWRPLPEPPVQS